MFETLFRTVFGDDYSAAAICGFDRPAATSSRVSRSRAVRPGNAVVVAGPAAKKSAIRRARTCLLFGYVGLGVLLALRSELTSPRDAGQ